MSATAATLLLTAGVLASMVVLSLWAAPQLPDGPVPVHFDIRGKADKFGSRWIPLGLLPILYVPLGAFMTWVAYASPSQEQGELLFGAGFAGFVTLAAHGLIIWLLLRWASRS